MTTWNNREIRKLTKKIEALQQQNKILTEENKELCKMCDSRDVAYESLLMDYETLRIKKGMPCPEGSFVLAVGKEKEFYPDEARSFVLDALNEYVRNAEPDRRRVHVLQSILNANQEQVLQKKRNMLKQELKDFTGMSTEKKRGLNALGFEVVEPEGKIKHHKILYHGDPRYKAVTSATSSDYRSGLNLASLLSKIAL